MIEYYLLTWNNFDRIGTPYFVCHPVLESVYSVIYAYEFLFSFWLGREGNSYANSRLRTMVQSHARLIWSFRSLTAGHHTWWYNVCCWLNLSHNPHQLTREFRPAWKPVAQVHGISRTVTGCGWRWCTHLFQFITCVPHQSIRNVNMYIRVQKTWMSCGGCLYVRKKQISVVTNTSSMEYRQRSGKAKCSICTTVTPHRTRTEAQIYVLHACVLLTASL
jgi:hypothetical protein